MTESKPVVPGSRFSRLGLLLLALLPACATAAATPPPEKPAAASEKTEQQQKIELAQLKLEKARVGRDKAVDEARVAVELAERKLEAARRMLTTFQGSTKAVQADVARLDLDRAIGRAADAAAELGELEAMYAAEEFAEQTKELVLTRGRRNLEHAHRSVAISETKLNELVEAELPAKEAELERGVLAAEGVLRAAGLALEIAELEGRVTIAEAEAKLKAAEKGDDEDDD